MFEVEAKFIADSSDFAIIEQKYKFDGPILERDVYYQHPSRDFLNTDEWLRLRTKTPGELNCLAITYKGANEKTESGIKTRQEIEFKASKEIVELLKILGFYELVRVEKYRRQSAILTFGNIHDPIVITLDEVIGLGKYIEIEVLVDDPEKTSQAVIDIEVVANDLGLNKPEKRGYAKMMLNKK